MICVSPLAVDGGTPVHPEPWPAWPAVSEADWRERVLPRLEQVYRSGAEGLPGTQAQAFAADFARYHDARWGLLTAHGTAAVSAALAAALDTDGLGGGGEVLVPNYTFIASATAALTLGCSVATVDIDPRWGTLSPAAVEAACGPTTTAVLAVHLGGQPCELDGLRAVCERRGLALVEDCAQAHGAAWRGRGVGSHGAAGAFSFQSSKNLCAGEGGLVTTCDPEVHERAAAFVNVGRRPGANRHLMEQLGYNHRPSEYVAALLAARWESFAEQQQRRVAGAAYLSELLGGVAGFAPPTLAPGATAHGWHLYACAYEPAAFGGRSRAEFVQALAAEGIPASGGYGAPLSELGPLQAVQRRHPAAVRLTDCPGARELAARAVWLPQRLLLAERADLAAVAEAVEKVRRAWN